LFLLADDIYKWLNNELPPDSSTLAYLQSCFDNPSEAVHNIRNEIQLIVAPFINTN
jgi:hypothetical protein